MFIKRRFVGCGGANTDGGIGAGIGEAEIAVVRFPTALEYVAHIKFGAVLDIIGNGEGIFVKANCVNAMGNWILRKPVRDSDSDRGIHCAALSLAAAVCPSIKCSLPYA